MERIKILNLVAGFPSMTGDVGSKPRRRIKQWFLTGDVGSKVPKRNGVQEALC